MKKQIGNCPVCSGNMIVSEYTCTECNTKIKGKFSRCELCNLPNELLHFVRIFLGCQGNIKEVERQLGLSYPTVKSRLLKINRMLDIGKFSKYVAAQNRLDLLKDFKEGKVSMNDVLNNLYAL